MLNLKVVVAATSLNTNSSISLDCMRKSKLCERLLTWKLNLIFHSILSIIVMFYWYITCPEMADNLCEVVMEMADDLCEVVMEYIKNFLKHLRERDGERINIC